MQATKGCIVGIHAIESPVGNHDIESSVSNFDTESPVGNHGMQSPVGMRLQKPFSVCKQYDGSTCCVCRGLFATHYHRLADAHEQDANVAICHMGCSVELGTNGAPEQVPPPVPQVLQLDTHYAALLLLKGSGVMVS